MFHPLALYIGLRYTRTKRKNNFISFISLVSIGGIALGLATMIVVLSVMNGFQHEVRSRSLSMTAHVAVTGLAGKPLDNWEYIADIAHKNPHVLGAAPYTYGQGLLSKDGAVHPIQIQGIDPKFESRVSDIALKMGKNGDVDFKINTNSQLLDNNVDSALDNSTSMDDVTGDITADTDDIDDTENDISGNNPDYNPDIFNSSYEGLYARGSLDSLKPDEFNIVLGIDLARKLGAVVGEKITLISAEVNLTAAGASPRVKRFNVVGIFDLGVYEYDSSIALVHISDAGKIFKFPENSVQGVRLKLDDALDAYPIALDISKDLGDNYEVYDWTQRLAALFRMIQIEKYSMSVIMSLIVAVAVFNVVSTLIMVVTDKRADIAILRTMGLSPAHIMIIFMVQGIVIGFVGAILGIILGLLIAFNVAEIVGFIEKVFNSTLFEPSVYPVSDIPTLVLTSDVVFVAGFAFLMASLATLYPAWKAAKTQPAEALRYE